MSRTHYVHSRRAEPEIDPGWIAVAVIVGAVGVRGMVRLKAFSDDLPTALACGAVTIFPDPHSRGERREIKLLHRIKAGYAGQISGVNNRDEAGDLKGVKLYIARKNLPEIEQEDSYYHNDMLGLVARDSDGRPFGVVKAIHNFGAGDLLEIILTDVQENSTKLYPFRNEFVAEINIDGGFVVIDRRAFGEMTEVV